MDTLLGLLIIYVWTHSVVIIVKHVHKQTSYETGVLIAGLLGVILYVIGTV